MEPYNTTPDEQEYVALRPNADQQWQLDNIKTIQDAVKNGEHKTMYYPAIGVDGLRCILAYDLDHLLSVDALEHHITGLVDGLNAMEIPYTERYVKDKTHEIEFEANGKKRKVTAITDDVRDVDIESHLENGKVDVLHIYKPTGADDSTDFDTGETIKKGISTGFDGYNLSLVNEGGFICIGEREITYYESKGLIPETFFQIFGLKPYDITEREPSTVMTFQMGKRDKPCGGKIYQKIAEVSDEVSSEFVDLSMNLMGVFYKIDEVIMNANYERGIEVDAGPEPQFGNGFGDWVKKKRELQDEKLKETGIDEVIVTEIGKSLTEVNESIVCLRDAGVEEETLEKLTYELHASINKKLNEAQETYKEFFEVYESVVERLTDEEIDVDQANIELGFMKTEHGTKNKRFPFAEKFFIDNPNQDLYLELAQEFAEMDLERISY